MEILKTDRILIDLQSENFYLMTLSDGKIYGEDEKTIRIFCNYCKDSIDFPVSQIDEFIELLNEYKKVSNEYKP